jgi:hypothetical protein
MKVLLFSIILGLSTSLLTAQQPAYKTLRSSIKLVAFQSEETNQWENTENTVFLDYKTGDFKVRLKNQDFYNPLHPAPTNPDLEQEEREFLLQGILPINNIINQKNTNQNYNVELQLICDDLRMNETIQFNMTITKPGSASQTYRIFSLKGILYNDQLNLPFFEGFDNEIEMFINFNGIFEGK